LSAALDNTDQGVQSLIGMLLRISDDSNNLIHVGLLARDPLDLHGESLHGFICLRLRLLQRGHIDGELRLLFKNELNRCLHFFAGHFFAPFLLARFLAGFAAGGFGFGGLPVLRFSTKRKSASLMNRSRPSFSAGKRPSLMNV